MVEIKVLSFCRLDLVDHHIMLAKLDHYEICGVSNYLSNCNQYVLINGYDSDVAAINCGISQGSVLGPLHFYCNKQP